MSGHLRGRVRPSHAIVSHANGLRKTQIVYTIEVVNTITGRVVHRDSHCGLSEACDSARENAARCREMWRMGIRSADLKRWKREPYLLSEDER